MQDSLIAALVNSLISVQSSTHLGAGFLVDNYAYFVAKCCCKWIDFEVWFYWLPNVFLAAGLSQAVYGVCFMIMVLAVLKC